MLKRIIKGCKRNKDMKTAWMKTSRVRSKAEGKVGGQKLQSGKAMFYT